VLGSFAMGDVPTLIAASPSTQAINGCPKTGLSANAGDAVSPVELGLDLHFQDHNVALSFWRVVAVGTISWVTDECGNRARGRVRLASNFCTLCSGRAVAAAATLAVGALAVATVSAVGSYLFHESNYREPFPLTLESYRQHGSMRGHCTCMLF